MSSALGDPPDPGTNALENAGPAATSMPTRAAGAARARMRRRRGRNDVSGLKAGGSLSTTRTSAHLPGARTFGGCPVARPRLSRGDSPRGLGRITGRRTAGYLPALVLAAPTTRGRNRRRTSSLIRAAAGVALAAGVAAPLLRKRLSLPAPV